MTDSDSGGRDDDDDDDNGAMTVKVIVILTIVLWSMANYDNRECDDGDHKIITNNIVYSIDNNNNNSDCNGNNS